MHIIVKRAKRAPNEFGPTKLICSASPHQHHTKEAAIEEARRLASLMTDYEFVILEEIGFAATVASPVEYTDVRKTTE